MSASKSKQMNTGSTKTSTSGELKGKGKKSSAMKTKNGGLKSLVKPLESKKLKESAVEEQNKSPGIRTKWKELLSSKGKSNASVSRSPISMPSPVHSSDSIDSASTSGRKSFASIRYRTERLSTTPTAFLNMLRTMKKSDVSNFIKSCFLKLGVDESYGKLMAEVLMYADSRRKFTTALVHLDSYVLDIMGGIIDANGQASIIKEFGSSAWVDGNKALGPVIGKYSMQMAINKAKSSGIGLVIANNSNFIGDPSWYSDIASSQGMIGITFMNSPPEFCPTRAKNIALGVNRFSISVPSSGKPLTFEMSHIPISLGKLSFYNRDSKNIPADCVLDRKGNITTDPEAALYSALFLPLGGSESNGGFKGYALAMFVEILCGILGDASYDMNVTERYEEESQISTSRGQCFIAVNPKFFASGFEERMDNVIKYLRNMEPADTSMNVLVPGDLERKNSEEVGKLDKVIYNQVNFNSAYLLSKTLQVKPIRSVSSHF